MKSRGRSFAWAAFIRMTLLCCALMVGAASVLPSAAYAGGGGGGGGHVQTNCKKFKGLVNRFGSCIKETVLKVAVKYFDKMYSFFRQALNLFLTLGIIIYGVLLAAGMVENVKRDSMVVLLKVAFVVFFAQNLEMIFFWLIDMMDGLIELYFQFSGSMDEGKCSQVSNGFGPFSRLDCLLDLVVGLKTSSYEGAYSKKLAGDGVSRGLIAFFFKSGISGSLGMVIGAVGFAIIYTIIFTVIKIVFMYLLALIAITFIVMLGPIFIPLVMFKVTKTYFDKWLTILVSFALQPVIMFAYVAVMIIAVDKAVFSGSNSLMSAIAGQDAKANEFQLNKWMDEKKVTKVDSPLKNYVHADHPLKDQEGLESGVEGSVDYTGIRRDESDKNKKSKVKNYMQGVPMHMIDWKKLAEARGGGGEEKEMMNEIMLHVVFLALVTYVFSSMLRHIPNVATDLSGGLYEAPNLWQVVGKNPLSEAAGNLGGSLKQGLESLINRGKA